MFRAPAVSALLTCLGGVALAQGLAQDAMHIAVQRVAETRVAAARGHDRQRLRDLLAPDVLLVTEAGMVVSADAAFDYPKGHLENATIRLFGDGAVVIGAVGKVRTLQVWTRTSGAWRLVAEQLTPISDGPAVPVPGAPPAGSPDVPDASGSDADELLAAERVVRSSIDSGRWQELIANTDYIGVVRDGQLEVPGATVVRLPPPSGREPAAVPQAEYELRLRSYGAVGVVSGTVFNRGESVRFLRVFARRDNEWKLVSSQSTSVRRVIRAG